MPKAYFVVRATVSDPARRAAFDAWYDSNDCIVIRAKIVHERPPVQRLGTSERGV